MKFALAVALLSVTFAVSCDRDSVQPMPPGALQLQVAADTLVLVSGSSTKTTVTVVRPPGFDGDVVISRHYVARDPGNPTLGYISLEADTIPRGSTTAQLSIGASVEAQGMRTHVTVVATGAGVTSARADVPVRVRTRSFRVLAPDTVALGGFDSGVFALRIYDLVDVGVPNVTILSSRPELSFTLERLNAETPDTLLYIVHVRLNPGMTLPEGTHEFAIGVHADGVADQVVPLRVSVQDALELPWTQLSGRIAVHYLAPPTRGVLLIDAHQRRVRYLGDFGTALTSLAISPDGNTIAVAYALGSPYNNFAGVRLVSSASTSIGRWETQGAFTDPPGVYAQWTTHNVPTWFRRDTLVIHNGPVIPLKAPLGKYSWSADDSKLYITHAGSSGGWDINVFDMGTNTLTTLIRSQAGEYWSSPVVQPGGNLIALKRAGSQQELYSLGEVWLANADGSGLRRLSATAVADIAWSPDGSQLLVAGSNGCPACGPFVPPGLYLMSLADGSVRTLMKDIVALYISWGR